MTQKILKAPLSLSIEKEYNHLISVLQKVPSDVLEHKVLEGTAGPMSIRDSIAYLIGWGTLLIGWYEAGIRGELPQMPGAGFTKWDYRGVAHYFYVHYRYESFQEQHIQLNSIVENILALVEKEYAVGHLDSLGVWAWCVLPSGKQWPLSKWITVNTGAPYKRTAQSIQRFLKTR